ncbi:MAG: GspE/PulE family protein [Pseudomonadota bacterium]
MNAITQRIGSALIDQAILPKDEWDRACKLAEQSDQAIMRVLDRLGLVAQEAWARASANALGMEFVDLEAVAEAPITDDRLSLDFQLHYRLVVLENSDTSVVVAVADPSDSYIQQAVELAFGRSVKVVVGVERLIEQALSAHVDEGASEEFDPGDDLDALRSMADDAPVIRFVDDLIADALKRRASDIHLEPFENNLSIRLRIDGALELTRSPPARFGPAVVSRLKILAGLDIAEQRLPQDGRIRLRIEGRDVDLRVATGPCLHGESVVLRLLERSDEAPTLSKLGMARDTHETVKRALSQTEGMVLVTGPTGSGKTTSLYAALHQLNDGHRKILTAEDPVEYQLDGIVQTPIKADIGRTFASTLRSMLRQDPDVVMVGEIRDTETARIGAQAALTGHLVLATLHTNDALSAIVRLRDMGLEPFILSAVIRACVAQRLVRRLCVECRRPADVSIKLPKSVTAALDRPPTFYSAVGCKACNGKGFSGRVGVFEAINVDEELRGMISAGASLDQLRQYARAKNVRSLAEDACLKAAQGLTTLEEAFAAVGER